MGQISHKGLDENDPVNYYQEMLQQLIEDTRFIRSLPPETNFVQEIKLLKIASRLSYNLKELRQLVTAYHNSQHEDMQSCIRLSNAVNEANRTIEEFKVRFCCG